MIHTANESRQTGASIFYQALQLILLEFFEKNPGMIHDPLKVLAIFGRNSHDDYKEFDVKISE